MSDVTAPEEKQKKGLRSLFRFLRKRSNEAALREAIEELIEETETTDTTETETTRTHQTDNQTTDRFELTDETTRKFLSELLLGLEDWMVRMRRK